MQHRYVNVYLLLIIVLFALSFLLPNGPIPADKEMEETAAAKATMDVFIEMSKLIGALTMAMLGAAGALVMKGKDWSTGWSTFDGMALVVTFVCGAVTFYGIYLGHTAVLQMVTGRILNVYAAQLQSALSIQYYGLLIGVFLLGLVFTRMLGQRLVAEVKKAS